MGATGVTRGSCDAILGYRQSSLRTKMRKFNIKGPCPAYHMPVRLDRQGFRVPLLVIASASVLRKPARARVCAGAGVQSYCVNSQ
jgi:hypothetical protein